MKKNLEPGLGKSVLSAAAAACCCISLIASPEERDWSEIYLALNPSVSHDGRHIAFNWNGRVWLAPTDGGTAVPVGDGMSVDSRPHFSPDDKRLAFLSDRWGVEQLFEADLDLEKMAISNMRQITFHTEGLMPCGYTPDGRDMLAMACRDDASESKTSNRLSWRPMFVSMSGGKAERLLFDAPASGLSLSPDGRKALFEWRAGSRGLEFRKRHEWSKTSCSGDIWMYDLGSGEFTPVVRRRDNCTSPVWAPDGNAFYYLCDAGGVRNVYRRSLATGEERQLTHFTDDHIFGPSLSRDGRTLVFVKGFDLWRMDPTDDGSEPRRIALKPAFMDQSAPRTIRRSYSGLDNEYDCTFRDGGKEVAFTAGGDVWVMQTKDDDREPLCIHGSSRTYERDVCFSPDGETLYYISDRGDGTDLWRVRRTATNRLWSAGAKLDRKRLVSDDACRRSLSVSPDGRLLAWCDMQGRLTFADTNGVVRSVAKTQSATYESYEWSPDGRYVAIALSDAFGNMDVWIVPTWDVDENGEKAPEPCNVSRNYKRDCCPAWSSDGRVIAFSGCRTSTGDTPYIFYAYLDPADEHAEANGGKIRNEQCRPDLKTLPDRVRPANVKGNSLFFTPDPRRLSFVYDKRIWTVKISEKMKTEKILDKDAKIASWLKDGDKDKILSTIGGCPAIGDKAYGFNAYKTLDVRDYQELAFLSVWARLRDGFCDANMHGADWPAVRGKYLPAARNAPCWNAFARVVYMMNGELDASHLGFRADDVAKKRWVDPPWRRGWYIFTCHLGVRFDRSYKGKGWLVKDVVPQSPADKGAEGLLPGDVVLSVDGRDVSSDMDYASVMTGHLPHKYRLRVRRGKGKKPLRREVDAITFSKARQLLRTADVDAARAAVREKGNFGYIAVDAMKTENADQFADEVFAECFGKDGLVVDVRFNTGGRTADRLIDILCGNRHCRALFRGVEGEGYLMDRYSRPVIADLPVVVLANERSVSNAEEFAHAMKTLGRAKVVGVETAGDVIATVDSSVFDYGVMRLPRIGMFLMDGRDMEGNGAKPDVEVDMTPSDVASGRDPQLAAALDVLAREVAGRTPPPPLRFAK